MHRFGGHVFSLGPTGVGNGHREKKRGRKKKGAQLNSWPGPSQRKGALAHRAGALSEVIRQSRFKEVVELANCAFDGLIRIVRFRR